MDNVGRYALVRRLGMGGMAEVYLARAQGPEGFEKTVALKRILATWADDPKFVQMFFAEARVAARLNHPNVVQVYEFGKVGDDYFIAMEYVDGPSLRQVVVSARQKQLELPLHPTLRLVAQACEGLHCAHTLVDQETGARLGVIHRDVSPDNILVSRAGIAKVTDFGIARAVDTQTRATTLRGKVSYFAPEQLRSAGAIDQRVDVWAMGVVLYELLTLRKPFCGATDLGTMQAILYDSYPAISLVRQVPDAVAAIVDRALQKDPAQRYASCRDMGQELDQALGTANQARTVSIIRLVETVAPGKVKQELPAEEAEVPSEPPSSPGPAFAESTLPAPAVLQRRALLAGLAAGALVAGAGMYLWRAPSAPELVGLPEFRGRGAALLVESDPPARLVLGGQERGTTPVRLVDMSPGELELELRAPELGFRKTVAVKLTEGDNGRLRVQGEKAKLQLQISPWARVLLNGREVGHTPLPPMEVWEGRHLITLVDARGRPLSSEEWDVAPRQFSVYRKELSSR
jgi:serine/threonine protein kinase